MVPVTLNSLIGLSPDYPKKYDRGHSTEVRSKKLRLVLIFGDPNSSMCDILVIIGLTCDASSYWIKGLAMVAK